MLLGSAACLIPVLLTACASPATHYFRLAVIAGAVLQSPVIKIGVRNVSIPGYLDQDGIAKPGSDVAFNTFANDVWAEPLGGMLQDVTVQELTQRLPAAIVISNSGAIAAAADLLIETNVLRFDPDSSGKIILVVQIALKSGRDYQPWLIQTLTYSAQPAGPDAASIAATMSTLWAGVMDQLGPMIIDQWNRHTAADKTD
jgi:uncharacterized lipoprotein YmbA